MKIPALIVSFCAALAVCPLRAQTSATLADYQKLEAKYNADSAAALDLINKRFIADLVALQKRATQTGDLNTALAIKGRLKAMGHKAAGVPELAGLAKFAGTWKIEYQNKYLRTYRFQADGGALWIEENGRPVKRKSKIRVEGSEFFLELEDNKIEKLSITNEGLRIEHYFPKDQLAKGEPPLLGYGTPVVEKK